MTTQLNRIAAVFATLCVAVLPSMAAEYSNWQGGESGIWGVGYEGNWDVYPDSTRYAVFGSPSTQTITVTVNEAVNAYGIQSSVGRKADIHFTGSGTLNNYRNPLFANNGAPITLDWDINVVNNFNPVSIYGTNVFHKTLDCSTAYTFSVKENSRLTLRDSAQLTGQHMAVAAGSSFECLDSSVVALTKDLNVNPGASLKVTSNAVLAPRGLYLPFSKEAGVNDEWTLDGGRIYTTNSSSYSLYFPYTNATKTVSGTGSFQMYLLNFSSATNATLRLNGPDMYIRSVAGDYKKNNYFEVGGGSTIGAWGADVNFSTYMVKFTGPATIDTTDGANRTTPRTITLSRFGACSGDLDVTGGGTLKLGTALRQPNLNLTVKGGTTFDATNQYLYALGDFVLKDSARFLGELYIGHQGYAENVKSLTMSDNTTLNVGRYVDISGDVALSGNASAVIRNYKKESNPLSCANLSLSGNASLTVMTGTVSCASITLADSASLSVPGTISSTSLAMYGNAHLAFTAGTAFTASSAFGDGNWTMAITIPAGYAAGIRPIVKGAAFGNDFASHVTLSGETAGWTVIVMDGTPVLYKGTTPSGIEWIGGSATSDNWSDPANWNGGTLPTTTDLVAFGGISRLTPYNDSLTTMSGLVFRASAGPFTITGSVEKLVLTADCNSRGSAVEAKANIVSHSGFTQTFDLPVEFPRCAYVLSDGGAEVMLKRGFYQGTQTAWQYFIAGGEVAIGGTCSASKLGFRTAASGKPTTRLRLLPGCDMTFRNQADNSFTEGENYIGRFVIEEGARMLLQGGECSFFYGALDNVVDGVLAVEGDGRLISGPNEQYYSGSGTIYAARALSGRYTSSANRYINFGGSLTLYMNGDWNTASYYDNGTKLMQDPNCPTRFCMTDGTTLGATANWTHGPAANAFTATNEIVTAAGRASVMTGTVTVNTQNPTNDTAHTITFVDPLDASDASVVKTGAGTLAFNEPEGYPSQISNLVVNAGTVAFASAPTFTGKLTLSSADADFRVLGLPGETGWSALATAAQIAGPDGQTEWTADDAKHRYRVVTSGGVSRLECSRDSGLILLFL